MTEGSPNACSLDARELRQRLDEIAAVGAGSLVEHRADGGRQLLRFRSTETTRRRLEKIVKAEAECCSFLDLSLEDRDGALLLSIGAPERGRPVAEELAAAFAGSSRQSG